MSFTEALSALLVWTPYLAGGFLWNIIISLASMVFGTLLGLVLALMRLSRRRFLVNTGLALTEFSRDIPTFVFLFYLAFIIPVEINIGGTIYAFPAWVKASLALAIAVVGFVADNLPNAIRHWRSGNHLEALLFIPQWTSYFVVIVMASSTASVIGVSELVSRCNTVIAAVGNTDIMIYLYTYAMLWFFGFCFPMNLLMKYIRDRAHHRVGKPA